MATKNTNYQLHLKGFVGGYDFDADYVDYILSKNSGKEVHVLIDSLGGKSNTALSIFSAFRRHGDVHVHFVGMNASAATIASLGARHITMDSSAMYLVHKCSIGFFEWGQLNSDGLQALIDNIEHQKADLDKLDANIAQMYATRCKKEPSALLDLMKAGGWLTAQEALAWGFVDELTDYEDETAPVLTDAVAMAMANAGIPIPSNIAKVSAPEQSAIARFFNSLASFFTGAQRHQSPNDQTTNSPNNQTPMKKIFTSICAILACEHLLSNDGKVTLEDGQLESIETAITTAKQTISQLQALVQTLTNEKQQLETDKQNLSASVLQLTGELTALKQKPGDTTAHVVNDQKPQQADKSEAQQYFETRANARALFDALP